MASIGTPSVVRTSASMRGLGRYDLHFMQANQWSKLLNRALAAAISNATS
jgi:hypothetical protein